MFCRARCIKAPRYFSPAVAAAMPAMLLMLPVPLSPLRFSPSYNAFAAATGS
jgi:hypothetical protein